MVRKTKRKKATKKHVQLFCKAWNEAIENNLKTKK